VVGWEKGGPKAGLRRAHPHRRQHDREKGESGGSTHRWSSLAKPLAR
jgi:hypothetical protein